MQQYYKFINETTLEEAPKSLIVKEVVDGKEEAYRCYGASEEEHNRQGYFRLETEPYPDDAEYDYSFYYDPATPERPYHLKKWRRGNRIEVAEPEKSRLDTFMETVAESKTVASIRGAAQVYREGDSNE